MATFQRQLGHVLGLSLWAGLLASCGSSSLDSAVAPVGSVAVAERSFPITVDFPTPKADGVGRVIPLDTDVIEVRAVSLTCDQPYFTTLTLSRDNPSGTLPNVPVGVSLLIGAVALAPSAVPLAATSQTVSIGATDPEQIQLNLVPDAPTPNIPSICPEGTAPIALSGLVTNANTGQPISGATVAIANTTLTTQTGPDGRYELAGEAPLAGATLLVSAPNTPGCNPREILLEAGATNQPVNVALNCSDQPVIILEWGVNPRDLDAHLLGDSGDRIAFFSRTTDFGTLDVDRTNSFGPETIQLNLSTAPNGEYLYCVHWFSGAPTDSSSDLPATVTFTGPGFGDQRFQRFFDGVSIGGPNGVWAVAKFEIQNGALQAVVPVDQEVANSSAPSVCNDFFGGGESFENGARFEDHETFLERKYQ